MIPSLQERALQFAEELHSSGFHVVNEVHFNQVMVKIGGKASTGAFVDAVNQSGDAWVGASLWFDDPVVRVSVCSWATSPDDVSRTIGAFVRARAASLGVSSHP